MVVEYPGGPQWREMVEGLLDRYGHPPTPFELGTDPFLPRFLGTVPGRSSGDPVSGGALGGERG
jgi:hypothetical protein